MNELCRHYCAVYPLAIVEDDDKKLKFLKPLVFGRELDSAMPCIAIELAERGLVAKLL